MRKIAQLIVLLLFVAVSSANAQERIVVRPTTSNSNGGISEQPDLQRSPIYIPSVFLTDYTLLFEENCIGCQVQILQDETVVYSSFVDEDGKVLQYESLDSLSTHQQYNFHENLRYMNVKRSI